MIDTEGHAQLTDFGLSREGVRNERIARSFCGSYAYLAPEMLKKTGHGKAVDWYLLGVVLYEMLVGQPPFYADEKEKLFDNILKNNLYIPSEVKRMLSANCVDFLNKLLEKNP